MRIAVTGATGFLGRYLVRHLASAGHTLRCWYRPTSDRTGLDDLAGKVEWVEGALGPAEDARRLVEGTDALVHAALYRPSTANFLGSARGDLDDFLVRNVMGSLRLFQVALDAGLARVVFVSTCAVHDTILPDRPLDEAHPLWPHSHYGAHKAAIEKFVHSFGLGEGRPICALRPTGIYGLAHPAGASKWFDLVGRVLRNEPIDSPRGGKEVHVADVARAAELLLNADAKAVAGQAFNCYDRYVSEEEVARLARAIAGTKGDISDRNKGPKNQIDTRKLRALGLTFGGEAILRRTVEELIAAHRGGER